MVVVVESIPQRRPTFVAVLADERGAGRFAQDSSIEFTLNTRHLVHPTPPVAPLHNPPIIASLRPPEPAAIMSLTNCRFYEEKYPEVESFVMVNVKQIAEMGAYVKLLEYGG